MFTRLSRRTFLKRYPNFVRSDNYHNKYFYPESLASYILHTKAGSTRGVCNKAAESLYKIATALSYQQLNFLGDNSVPWLFRGHDYTPVTRALQYLADQKVTKNFNGAIMVDIADLPEFTKHLFWLVRCNGIMFYPYFSDPGFNIMGSICQYGNLHISTLNEATDLAFNNAITGIGLQLLESNNCGGGKIPGRRATYPAGN